MPYRICLISLGCAKNQVNSEQMLYLLNQAGHDVVGEVDGCDVAIVNTCGFIDTAKSEAIQNILELGVEMLEKMTQGILGPSARRFANYIGTIFLFILFCNLSGLFGLRTVTADFGVTFLLGLVTFAIVQYQGIKNHGVGHFTGLFKPLPVLFPINLIGEFANPISISLRLFANMLSGVIILGLWYGMMPIFVKIGIPAALHVYCDLFSGCIQTYVFCMLTMVYVNDKL